MTAIVNDLAFLWINKKSQGWLKLCLPSEAEVITLQPTQRSNNRRKTTEITTTNYNYKQQKQQQQQQ